MVKGALRLAPIGYKQEAKSFWQATCRAARPRAPAKQCFVVFGRARSGSTLLVHLLKQHPEIDCLGEVLHYPSLAPVAFVERELRQLRAPYRGFKLLTYQVREFMRPRQTAAMRNWIEREELKIFYLQRQNLLDLTISNLYARAREAYHSTDVGTEERKIIHIDPDQVIREIAYSQGKLEWEKWFLNGLEYEEVVYETDLATPDTQQAAVNRLAGSLGLEPALVKAHLKKVTPRDHSSFVSNWDEIVHRLRETPMLPS